MSLLPHHLKMLREESGISDAVIEARGYASITGARELKNYEFRAGQFPCGRDKPALLIPIWDVSGRKVCHVARPDEPRWKEGKPVKYEFPQGRSMVIDVPPAAREMLGNPQ